MSKFVKDMLKARYDRHQIPPMYYGDSESRDRYGRDSYSSDYARNDYRRSDYTHQEPRYDMRSRDYEHYQQYPDHRDNAMRGRRDGRRDYDDYNREDYGEMEYGKMSEKDIEKWSESLVNSDGTKGKHFKKDQIEHIIKQTGIDVRKMGGEHIFCMTMNMMYADYCAAAKRFGVNVPEFYAELAKAFLEDKDFHGEPEEKLWLYYKCIAEQED